MKFQCNYKGYGIYFHHGGLFHLRQGFFLILDGWDYVQKPFETLNAAKQEIDKNMVDKS